MFRPTWRRPRPTLEDQAADILAEFDKLVAPASRPFAEFREACGVVMECGTPDDVAAAVDMLRKTIRSMRFSLSQGMSLEAIAEQAAAKSNG